MSDMIMPLQPPSEVVAVVRNAEHLIDRLMQSHGIDARRIRALDLDGGPYSLGNCMADELADLLYRVFTDWDRCRTEEVERLKKQVTELVALTPVRMVIEKDGTVNPADQIPWPEER